MVKNTNKLYTILAGMLVFGTMMSFCCLSRAESLAQKTVPNLANNAQSNGSPKGLLADRDNDGLSDGLQRLLNEIPSNQFIDVIVTFKGPGNAHSAQQAVGPFNVKRKFNIISGFFATARRVITEPKLSGSGCPAYLIRSGFGSQRSTWLGPPCINR